MAGKKKTEFPKEIFVTVEVDGDDEYFGLREDIEEVGETSRAAKYQLVETGEVKVDTTWTFTPRKAGK